MKSRFYEKKILFFFIFILTLPFIRSCFLKTVTESQIYKEKVDKTPNVWARKVGNETIVIELPKNWVLKSEEKLSSSNNNTESTLLFFSQNNYFKDGGFDITLSHSPTQTKTCPDIEKEKKALKERVYEWGTNLSNAGGSQYRPRVYLPEKGGERKPVLNEFSNQMGYYHTLIDTRKDVPKFITHKFYTHGGLLLNNGIQITFSISYNEESKHIKEDALKTLSSILQPPTSCP